MNHKHHLNLLTVLIILMVVTQVLTVYYLILWRANLSDSIENLREETMSEMDFNVRELNSKINELSNAIESVSSSQMSIKEQVSEIKASTSSDFSGVIEDEIEGVVTIKTDVSQGTGFFVDERGFVVTNAHVLAGARLANIHTFDSEVYPATLVGYDLEMDIALMKISGNFEGLELGDSDEVRIGEKVIAIGNPLGLSFTATEGIISAKNREGVNGLPYYFQTDVALNPGNSGGPLINTKGEVIGINNFKVSGAENVGFALEINHAEETINELALEVLNETIV